MKSLLILLITVLLLSSAQAASSMIHCLGPHSKDEDVEATIEIKENKVVSRLKINHWYLTLPTSAERLPESTVIEIKFSNGGYRYFLPDDLVDGIQNEADVEAVRHFDQISNSGTAFCKLIQKL